MTGLNGVIRQLRKTAMLQECGLSDGQLLESFLTQQDEGAFEALVRRHGPMVWGVCRRALSNPQDAEDAFQATFLVLLRKAATLRQKDLLGNWLYGVAFLTARKAKAMTLRRKRNEQTYRPVTPSPPPAEATTELRAVLDQELAGLAEKYRTPIVLCDLEGVPLRVAGGVAASALQLHPHATVVVDDAAAARLSLAGYYRETWARKPAWQGI